MNDKLESMTMEEVVAYYSLLSYLENHATLQQAHWTPGTD